MKKESIQWLAKSAAGREKADSFYFTDKSSFTHLAQT